MNVDVDALMTDCYTESTNWFSEYIHVGLATTLIMKLVEKLFIAENYVLDQTIPVILRLTVEIQY